MIAALHVINLLAGVIHGGALLTFALLLNFRRAIPHVKTWDVVRVYRAFGAGIGLSLGAYVPTELFRHIVGLHPSPHLPEALALRWDSTDHSFNSAKMILLFVLWVSYIHLEVWTIEPTRRLDKEGVVADAAAYEAAAGRVGRQLAFNAVLFAVVLSLGALTQAWP
jgi:hypothetical protein